MASGPRASPAACAGPAASAGWAVAARSAALAGRHRCTCGGHADAQTPAFVAAAPSFPTRRCRRSVTAASSATMACACARLSLAVREARAARSAGSERRIRSEAPRSHLRARSLLARADWVSCVPSASRQGRVRARGCDLASISHLPSPPASPRRAVAVQAQRPQALSSRSVAARPAPLAMGARRAAAPRRVARVAPARAGKQGKVNKVVLAYSGGLDTSVILKWLQETYDCEVVTFTADLGQVRARAPLANRWRRASRRGFCARVARGARRGLDAVSELQRRAPRPRTDVRSARPRRTCWAARQRGRLKGPGPRVADEGRSSEGGGQEGCVEAGGEGGGHTFLAARSLSSVSFPCFAVPFSSWSSRALKRKGREQQDVQVQIQIKSTP